MIELEMGGMQKRTLHAERRSPLAVDRITDERMVNRRKVDANLVGPPSLEATLEKRTWGRSEISSGYLIFGSSPTAISNHGHSERITP